MRRMMTRVCSMPGQHCQALVLLSQRAVSRDA